MSVSIITSAIFMATIARAADSDSSGNACPWSLNDLASGRVGVVAQGLCLSVDPDSDRREMGDLCIKSPKSLYEKCKVMGDESLPFVPSAGTAGGALAGALMASGPASMLGIATWTVSRDSGIIKRDAWRNVSVAFGGTELAGILIGYVAGAAEARQAKTNGRVAIGSLRSIADRAATRQSSARHDFTACITAYTAAPEVTTWTSLPDSCLAVRKASEETPLIRDALEPALADIAKMDHAISAKEQSARTREGDWLAFYQNTRSRSAASTMRGLDLPPPLESLWCSRWKTAAASNDKSLTQQLRSELSTYFQACPS